MEEICLKTQLSKSHLTLTLRLFLFSSKLDPSDIDFGLLMLSWARNKASPCSQIFNIWLFSILIGVIISQIWISLFTVFLVQIAHSHVSLKSKYWPHLASPLTTTKTHTALGLLTELLRYNKKRWKGEEKSLFEHVCVIAAKEHGMQVVPKECETKVDGAVFVDMSRTEPFCKPLPLRTKT